MEGRERLASENASEAHSRVWCSSAGPVSLVLRLISLLQAGPGATTGGADATYFLQGQA